MDIRQIATGVVQSLKPAEFRMGVSSRQIILVRSLRTGIASGLAGAFLWLLQRYTFGGDEPASGALYVAAVVGAIGFLFKRRMLLQQRDAERRAAMRRKANAATQSQAGSAPGTPHRTEQGGTAT